MKDLFIISAEGGGFLIYIWILYKGGMLLLFRWTQIL